ncbi:glycosyltransferase [uncultured Enterovirga sp.]|uniref:CgeB family protein n=1 Tax=uncultured Enterovirga sp. TaxID=2026352 RepID=UPI0035CA578D
MKIVYFTHSLLSCWNHGNAHFLRGVLRDLTRKGHEVVAYEPADSWSLDSLRRDHGEDALAAYRAAYPELTSLAYGPEPDLDRMLDGADLVLVHEWNEPWLVAAIGAKRVAGGRFTLLFHDTHHRVVSDPEAMRRYDLDGYDGILAFGETVALRYRDWGWRDRAFVWHEAADHLLFCPPTGEGRRDRLVWIGNWGDEERSEELEGYLFRPAQQLGRGLDVYGVRYPDHALATLARYGARYHGWAANAAAPAIFARHLATAHVPRRFYVEHLPGIPTIRVFEALSCGIPLVSAPWQDSERLFRVGTDFLMAQNEREMEDHLRAVQADPDLRRSLAARGRETILARHTCAHRADELLAIVQSLATEIRQTA